MALEKEHDLWYVVDGLPLSVEEVERFQEGRVWRAMQRGLSDQIAAYQAMREDVEISHARERYLLGWQHAGKFTLGLTQSFINDIRTRKREDLIHGRRDDAGNDE
jgi:hypothetical protein